MMDIKPANVQKIAKVYLAVNGLAIRPRTGAPTLTSKIGSHLFPRDETALHRRVTPKNIRNT